MRKHIKINLTKIKQGVSLLMCLSSILLASCTATNITEQTIEQTLPLPPNKVLKKEIKQKNSNAAEFHEVVLFCGNTGVGKSALCNSIFQQTFFESGPNFGQGMTLEKQAHTYEGVDYIDTPGLADVALREKAAKEIEEALKQNGNYKIVFVATLEAGRIKPEDLATINTVCDAITTEFSYGIIFNKVTKNVLHMIENDKNKDAKMKAYLSSLHKAPSRYLVIEKEEAMEDASNIRLNGESENRAKLLKFISELIPNVILDKSVTTIDVDAYQKMVDELSAKLDEAMKTISKQSEELQGLTSQVGGLNSTVNTLSSQLSAAERGRADAESARANAESAKADALANSSSGCVLL